MIFEKIYLNEGNERVFLEAYAVDDQTVSTRDAVLVIPGVIFSETSLTYLKIVDLDSATMSSVGSMLSAGQGVMTEAPHALVFPAVFISLLMICFNLFGNGLRDAFNPSLRGTED